jgi:tripartite-type tricarboxylate transporter receptor subunit TctC
VIVDNRTGAGGNIGAKIAAKAPPDGYTLFQASMPQAINVSMYRNLAYDLVRDFAPVTQMASGPQLLLVHLSLSDCGSIAGLERNHATYASARLGHITRVSRNHVYVCVPY